MMEIVMMVTKHHPVVAMFEIITHRNPLYIKTDLLVVNASS
jgi:hypothetical protein